VGPENQGAQACVVERQQAAAQENHDLLVTNFEDRVQQVFGGLRYERPHIDIEYERDVEVKEQEDERCMCGEWQTCAKCDGVPRSIGYSNVDITALLQMRDLERKYPKRVYPSAVDGFSSLSWLGYTRIFGGGTSMTSASYTIFFFSCNLVLVALLLLSGQRIMLLLHQQQVGS